MQNLGWYWFSSKVVEELGQMGKNVLKMENADSENLL